MRKFYVCDLIKVISYQIHILNCRFNFPDLSNGATVAYNGKYRFEIWQRQINGSLMNIILHEFLLKSLFYFFSRPFKPSALQGVRQKRIGEAVHLLHTLHQCRWWVKCNYCGSSNYITGTMYIIIYIS